MDLSHSPMSVGWYLAMIICHRGVSDGSFLISAAAVLQLFDDAVCGETVVLRIDRTQARLFSHHDFLAGASDHGPSGEGNLRMTARISVPNMERK